MASTTAYLGLKLHGTTSADRATLFEDWRQDMNGTQSSSNMQIIDRACKEMADDISALENGIITAEQIDALFT